MNYKILTRKTSEGRDALKEVMDNSYVGDIEYITPFCARTLIVDDVPVAFILVDPDRTLDFGSEPSGLRYAWVADTAVHKDHRGKGYFRILLEETFASIKKEGISIVILHGEFELYNRFDFDVFTHQRGIFIDPKTITDRFGNEFSGGLSDYIVVDEQKAIKKDLLVIPKLVCDKDDPEMFEKVMLSAALEAKKRNKSRILFEHPFVKHYGTRYEIIPYAVSDNFSKLAESIGAEIIMMEADPMAGTVKHGDFIKILDVNRLLFEAVYGLGLESTVYDEIKPWVNENMTPVEVGQMVTGFRVPENLSHVFSKQYRFSRNESWIYDG